jgi:hypothetical protein
MDTLPEKGEPMNKPVVIGLTAMALGLIGAPLVRAGVGVSPPGRGAFDPPAPIRVTATLGGTTFSLAQDIIGPEKPTGIIGPEFAVTALTHLEMTPPDGTRPQQLDFKVSAADNLTARTGGLVVALGALAGIIGPEVVAILAKEGLPIELTEVIGNGSMTGIVGPDRAADLISAALSAVVPPGECTTDHLGGPTCYSDLPGMFRAGATALGFATSCGAP